jgi:type IV pilus assembly protein PilC
MRFRYQARTKEGLIQTGIVEASSETRAASLLQEQGLYVTLLEEEKAQPFYTREIEIFGRVSRKDIVMFSRQLSLLLKSGVTLVEALKTLASQSEKPKLRQILLKLSSDVEGGTYFSEALLKFPKQFSLLYINMVKSGEASGRLSETLSYLADHLEREYNLLAKVKGAMLYPFFIILVFLFVLGVFVFFVLPQFGRVLAQMGVEMPVLTRAIFAGGNFVKSWWWIFLLGLTGLGVFLWKYFETKEGKELLARTTLKIPVLSQVLRKIYLARLTENLSTLVAGGLPIIQSLEITSGVIGNKIYEDIILEIRDRVRRGESISAAFEQYSEEIPLLIVQMVRVGEKTGRLDESLMSVADFYEAQVNRLIDNLVDIIQPILILLLGGLVGLLMLAVFLPIYKSVGSFTF